MSEREKKNILIEKFLKEELSQEELVEFRAYWDSDPAFVKEVQDYSRLTVALKAAKRLKDDEKKTSTGVISHFKKAFFKYQSVAAIFLIAIMLPLYLLLQGQKRVITPESPEVRQLAKSNYIRKNLASKLAQDSLFKEVKVYFDQGKTADAIFILDQMEQENKMDYAAIKAGLFFELDQHDSAVYYYKIGFISNPTDSTIYWNALMSQLWMGELETSKIELRKLIKKPGGQYFDTANQLLLELE
ncbi:MAG: hypothetical protein ABJF11_02220 [Reichenbachiella sp.]|uniref:hypothetical protein n=1 Tax=Reichenbachiella sp. TaxID=2184521 RepID=UPI00326750C8